MKPTSYFVAATLLLCISCGNKTEKPALAGDTLATEIPNTAPSDPAQAIAPDVRMHDLRGNVKSLKLYYEENTTDWCFHLQPARRMAHHQRQHTPQRVLQQNPPTRLRRTPHRITPRSGRNVRGRE